MMLTSAAVSIIPVILSLFNQQVILKSCGLLFNLLILNKGTSLSSFSKRFSFSTLEHGVEFRLLSLTLMRLGPFQFSVLLRHVFVPANLCILHIFLNNGLFQDKLRMLRFSPWRPVTLIWKKIYSRWMILRNKVFLFVVTFVLCFRTFRSFGFPCGRWHFLL